LSTPALPPFLTAEQIASMLQVDERTVLCWADRMHRCPWLGSAASWGWGARQCCGGWLGSNRARCVCSRKPPTQRAPDAALRYRLATIGAWLDWRDGPS